LITLAIAIIADIIDYFIDDYFIDIIDI
jgi:hypothetical protein